jgi:hypothetical protein
VFEISAFSTFLTFFILRTSVEELEPESFSLFLIFFLSDFGSVLTKLLTSSPSFEPAAAVAYRVL